MQGQSHSDSSPKTLAFDMIDTIEVREHPKIKGLPVRRRELGATLVEAEGAYPWLRTKENVQALTRLVSLSFGLARLLAGWVPGLPELRPEDPDSRSPVCGHAARRAAARTPGATARRPRTHRS